MPSGLRQPLCRRQTGSRSSGLALLLAAGSGGLAAVAFARGRPFDGIPRGIRRHCTQAQLGQFPETYVPPSDGCSAEGLYFCEDSGSLGWTLSAASGHLRSWSSWYRAPWWLRQGDAMTVAASRVRAPVQLGYERHLVPSADGGLLALDVAVGPETQEHNQDTAALPRPVKLVLLLPGLGGGSERGNVRAMSAALAQQGFRSATLNMRSMGGSPVQTPRFFSAMRGSTDDVRTAIRYLRQELLGGGRQGEEAQIVVVGWSNGGTIALNFLAEQSTSEGLGHAGRGSAADGGAGLGAPCDLLRGTAQFEKSWPMQALYNRVLTDTLVSQVAPHLHLFRNGPVALWPGAEERAEAGRIAVDADEILAVKKLRAFDDSLTRRVFGYSSVEDYYHDASPLRRLDKIQVPTLLVSAADDPVVSGWIPAEEVRSNPWLVLVNTAHGGHLGWLDEDDFSQSIWLQRVVIDFVTIVTKSQ
ncbi:unnamed protein product [Polarella glacialis]|uniref:AB hydrolase-1 domain-containing protein n=1 Tax=Polarella glacialis TaxID=89957 RepID=A0A813LQW0_POLGL|nr:unnamed protein product [Polarella glacialis]